MKAQEVRLGNYVSIYGKYVKIEHHDFINDYKYSAIYRFEPIPLTEEILLKCGFEKEDEYMELQVNEHLSIIWIGYLGLLIDGSIIGLIDNDYLHQLQNLYFALTQTELEVKL